jgi:urea transporter
MDDIIDTLLRGILLMVLINMCLFGVVFMALLFAGAVKERKGIWIRAKNVWKKGP